MSEKENIRMYKKETTNKHDGFCELLGIWRPKPTITDKKQIPEKQQKFKWVRDPKTDKWIHQKQVFE